MEKGQRRKQIGRLVSWLSNYSILFRARLIWIYNEKCGYCFWAKIVIDQLLARPVPVCS